MEGDVGLEMYAQHYVLQLAGQDAASNTLSREKGLTDTSFGRSGLMAAVLISHGPEERDRIHCVFLNPPFNLLIYFVLSCDVYLGRKYLT